MCDICVTFGHYWSLLVTIGHYGSQWVTIGHAPGARARSAPSPIRLGRARSAPPPPPLWSLLVTIGHYWSLLVTIGHYWSLWVTIGHYWSLLVTIGHYWSRLSHFCFTIGHYWSLWVTIVSLLFHYWSLLVAAYPTLAAVEADIALPDHHYWSLLVTIGHYWSLLTHYWSLLVTIGRSVPDTSGSGGRHRTPRGHEMSERALRIYGDPLPAAPRLQAGGGEFRRPRHVHVQFRGRSHYPGPSIILGVFCSDLFEGLSVFLE
jgi:hypothetical protein